MNAETPLDVMVSGAAMAGPCLWCGDPFRLRRGGSKRRFCSRQCRTTFHSACRVWAVQAVLAGQLTLDVVKTGSPAACTLPQSAKSLWVRVEGGRLVFGAA